MFFMAIRPEMLAAAAVNLSAFGDDLAALAATQFAPHAATHRFVSAGWYAATDAANWVEITQEIEPQWISR